MTGRRGRRSGAARAAAMRPRRTLSFVPSAEGGSEQRNPDGDSHAAVSAQLYANKNRTNVRFLLTFCVSETIMESKHEVSEAEVDVCGLQRRRCGYEIYGHR